MRSASKRERSKYAFFPQGSFELTWVANAAASFDWSTSPEGQTINIESGVSIPTVKDKATLEKYLAKAPPSRQSNQVFLDAMKFGKVQPVTPAIGWNDWGTVWNAERDKVMNGQSTAKQFADVVVPKLNALIKEKSAQK